MDIAVIGSTMTDLVTRVTRMPGLGETFEGHGFSIGFGGKGANQAVAAGRLGSQVLMVTRVGNDVFADNSIGNFQANGIDTTHVLRTEAPSGVAPIFVDDDAQNSITIVPGANAHLSPADVDAATDLLAGCKLVVLQLEVPLETVYHAIEVCSRLGVPVLLNPAPAHPDLDLSRIGSVAWFVPNESELALLTGAPVDSIEQVTAAARTLLGKGIGNVVVTLGSRGALWVHDEVAELVKGRAVQAVDTTGAGDAFIGCFSHALASGVEVHEALAMSNRYAADSVTRPGTQSSYADAEAFAKLA